MPGFVKLTHPDGEAAYLNVDFIESFMPPHSGPTRIAVRGSGSYGDRIIYKVQETADEIAEAIYEAWATHARAVSNEPEYEIDDDMPDIVPLVAELLKNHTEKIRANGSVDF